MNIKLKIGKRIKELREQSSISQKDLAFTANLDRSYITSIENGQRNVSIINIEKIVLALGIDLKTFFDDDKFKNITEH